MFGMSDAHVPEVSTQEVDAMLAAPGAPFVLDVREPGEYAVGHIAGSHLIPLGSLPERHSEVPRDRKVVVVCRSGGRSASATRLLLAEGHDATNMAGGMLAWRGPVER
ncbi:MAG TPA: rhodanese-like domain-containing protein [Pantanalinema sp.]